MGTYVTVQEEDWLGEWLYLVNKMPAPLMMMIDADASDCSVVVVLHESHSLQPEHTRWISLMNAHLNGVPGTEAWLRTNPDGWHFGKGRPTVTTSTSYGANGACASSSDDYKDHYIQSVMMPFCSVPAEYQIVGVLDSEQGDTKAVLVTR
jgi:hypothetical protein